MPIAEGMQLRHLRHFIAVAEELHFGRAAKRLAMAQPPLSQSIMRLEQHLGTTLIDRSARAIKLTAAGAILLPEAREILARADLAERLVERLSAGEQAKLRVGFVPMSATLALPRAIRAFHRQWPKVQILLTERSSAAQAVSLREGALDLGILVSALADTSGLQCRPIERYGFVAAIPSKWRLASRSQIRLADLAGQPLILFPQQLVPNFYSDFEAACQSAGFRPQVQQRVAQPYSMFALVSQELGIGIVQETARELAIGGVSFVPIRDMPSTLAHEVALAWVPRAVPRHLRDLIATISSKAIRTNT